MVTIYIHNVTSKIEGLTQEQNDALYEYLSYETKNDTFVKLKNKNLIWIDLRKRLFTPKRCTFPTGLLEEVKRFLNVPIIIIDERKIPEKYNFFVLQKELDPLRYFQKQVMEIIKKNPMSAISASTGSGKTLIMMSAVKEWGVNTLIVTPNLNLNGQVLDVFKYHFGSKFVGDHKEKKLKEITVANIQGIHKNEESWFKHFDAIVWEECHHISADTYHEVAKMTKHITYRLAVSATLFRNSGDELKLIGLTGPALYTYSAKQAITDGHIVPPKFVVYDIGNEGLGYGDFFADYERYIVQNNHRNRIIINSINSILSKSKKSILVLVNRLDHIEQLKKDLTCEFGIVTGEEKSTDNKRTIENFLLGKIRLILATSNCMGEGLDINNVDVLILGGGFQSEILISQSVGRCVRLNKETNKQFGLVIDFIDNSSPILKKHSKERLRIYKENYLKEYINIIKA